jgi:hypothetical protein
MSDEAKIVLERATLVRGDALQKVATAYLSGQEYRVYAPARAEGNALNWIDHLIVHRDAGYAAEEEVLQSIAGHILKSVVVELEKKRDANRAVGLNPDGRYCDAQICLNGHVVHCDGAEVDPKAHCTKCGAPCICDCPHCDEPIRGVELYQSGSTYVRPQFCHHCGYPYPWMEEQLSTARELLENEKKLSPEDREKLWKDIRYVVSDPKAELAAGKKILIKSKLETLSSSVREFVLELMAKTAAEIVKGQ